MPTVYALSIHATYGCQERGACCTAGWPIPIEADRLDHLRQHAPRSFQLIEDRDGTGDTSRDAVLLPMLSNACVFHTDARSHRCSLHAELGHSALPLACRQFPRVSVQDPRGTSVTLSHYCPAAADLLATNGVVSVVQDPPAFPPSGEYVGLDARTQLPPLLTPAMLMDWDAWWLLEREAVALIAGSQDLADALARVGTFVADVESWRPARGALPAFVLERARRARMPPARGSVAGTARRISPQEAVAIAARAMPSAFRPQEPPPRSRTVVPQQALRFLAAHAFANWTIHMGHGVRTWLRSLDVAAGLLEHGFTVSEADLWLRHLVDPQQLVNELESR